MALSHSPSIITDNLKLYFDAGNKRSYKNGLIYNMVSPNFSETISGATFLDQNKGCLLFDGVNDYINVTNLKSNDFTLPFSVSVWFNAYEISNINQGAYRLFSRQKSGSTRCAISIDGSNINLHLSAGTLYLPTPININTWYNIVAIWHTNLIELYLNGVLMASQSHSFVDDINDSPVQIGMLSSDRFFNGLISHLMLYTKALSEREVKQNFNSIRGRYGV